MNFFNSMTTNGQALTIIALALLCTGVVVATAMLAATVFSNRRKERRAQEQRDENRRRVAGMINVLVTESGVTEAKEACDKAGIGFTPESVARLRGQDQTQVGMLFASLMMEVEPGQREEKMLELAKGFLPQPMLKYRDAFAAGLRTRRPDEKLDLMFLETLEHLLAEAETERARKQRANVVDSGVRVLAAKPTTTLPSPRR